MSTVNPEDLQALEALKRAITRTLERKRRLGQYAVLWRDGHPVLIGEDAPPGPYTVPGPGSEGDRDAPT